MRILTRLPGAVVVLLMAMTVAVGVGGIARYQNYYCVS